MTAIARGPEMRSLPLMSDWVSSGLPVFAVVGRVNMGKSSVLATLLEIDDNELLRISPTPGETVECQIHRVVFGGRECLRFIDTPGFSQPIEAMREIQRIHGHGTPGLDAIREFVRTAGGGFADEARLLEPLVQGAGVLYVVDPAKPLRDDFLAEMEILRWTGRPRLAVLNRRGEGTGFDEAEWKSRLGATFNLTRTFDAHRARFGERLRLLRSLLEIEENHRARLEETIRLVESEFRVRREETAEIILGFLEESLLLRARATLEEKDLAIPIRRDRKSEILKDQYFAALAELERKSIGKILTIYRHHLLESEIDPSAYRGIDLDQEETWSKWGLRRGQLALAAGIAGAAAGVAIDIGTGGLSHGAGTVLGALTGGAAAWFKGGELPDLRIDLGGGVKLGTGTGRMLEIGPPKNPNFPWVLLDSMLVRYSALLARAHGRRDREKLVSQGNGFTRDFPAARRKVLAKWFGTCLRDSPDRSLEPEVFNALVAALEDIGEAGPAA